MRSVLCLSLITSVATCILAPAPATAQTQSSAPENFALGSYRKAREVLDAGVVAIGGAAELAQVDNVTRVLSVKRMDPGQARGAWNGEYDMKGLPVYSQGVMTSTLDYARDRLRVLIRDENIPGEADSLAEVIAADGSFSLRWMRAEAPFYTPLSAGAARARFSREVRLHPEALLKAALRQLSTLEWSGQSVVDGSAANVISFIDSQGLRIFLSFDVATHRLVKSESISDHSVLGDSTLSATFSDFRKAGPFTLPHRVISKRNDAAARDYRMTSISFDTALAQVDFAPPQSHIPTNKDPDSPMLVPRGDGLFEVRGEYNVMFAVFADYVLLIESPRDESYARQVFDLIRSVAPNMPVKVVGTHHHYDHLGGMRYAASVASEIWAGSDAKAEIERALKNRPTIRPDEYAKSPKSATIKLIDKQHTFSDGKQRVEIVDIGPVDHADQLLVAYFPSIATMLVADLWDVPATDMPLTGIDADQLMARVKSLGWKVDQMLATHGGAASMAALERSLSNRANYLETRRVGATSAVRR